MEVGLRLVAVERQVGVLGHRPDGPGRIWRVAVLLGEAAYRVAVAGAHAELDERGSPRGARVVRAQQRACCLERELHIGRRVLPRCEQPRCEQL
eukprot:7349281-Prymnesium_polylepis.1